MTRKPITDEERAKKAEWCRAKYRRERGLPEDAVLRPVIDPEQRKAIRKEQKRISDHKRYAARKGMTVEEYDAHLKLEAAAKARRNDEAKRLKEAQSKAVHRVRLRIVECQPKVVQEPKKTPQQIEAERILRARAEMKRKPGAIARGYRVRYLG
jgi:hypothetical protein